MMTLFVFQLVQFVLDSSSVSSVMNSCKKVEALLCLNDCDVVYQLQTVSYEQIKL